MTNINHILRGNPRNCSRGAPMGSRNHHDAPETPMHLQRVQFVDGDYGPDGTYWGSGEPIYCAFTPDLVNKIYVRARSRKLAIVAILEDYDAKFIRGD